MPTSIVLPASVGGQDTWTLGAGSDKVSAVSTIDDLTSYIARAGVGTVNGDQNYWMNPAPSGTVSIQAVRNIMRTLDNTGDANKVTHQCIYLVNAATTFGTTRSTGNSFQTYTETIARPGGGNWQLSDWDGGTSSSSILMYIRALVFDVLSNIFCTYLVSELDYTLGGSQLSLFVAQWGAFLLAAKELLGANLPMAQLKDWMGNTLKSSDQQAVRPYHQYEMEAAIKEYSKLQTSFCFMGA